MGFYSDFLLNILSATTTSGKNPTTAITKALMLAITTEGSPACICIP